MALKKQTNKQKKKKPKKPKKVGVPIVAQRKQVHLGTMRFWVRSPALLSGLSIWRCHELWCRSQTQLRCCIAVAVAQAGSCNSDSTPSLGTSICHGCSPKRQKKKRKKKSKKERKKKRKCSKCMVDSNFIMKLHHIYTCRNNISQTSIPSMQVSLLDAALFVPESFLSNQYKRHH